MTPDDAIASFRAMAFLPRTTPPEAVVAHFDGVIRSHFNNDSLTLLSIQNKPLLQQFLYKATYGARPYDEIDQSVRVGKQFLYSHYRLLDEQNGVARYELVSVDVGPAE